MTVIVRPIDPLPAHPTDYLETLARLKATAYELIDAIVREESGVRAGDGCWYDGNPVTARICEPVELHFGNGRPWSGALRKARGQWRHDLEPLGRCLDGERDG